MSNRGNRAIALLCASSLCGCSDLAGGAREAVQDSSGVTIVSTAAEFPPSTWTVSGDPLISIGVVEGDSAYQLFAVQDAIRLSDGRIIVANGGSDELRYYGDTGAFLMSVGGSGRGPGEFSRIADILPLDGDSVLVADGALRRVTLLDAQGQVVTVEPGRPPIARLVDGTFVRQAHGPGPDTLLDGPYRDIAFLVRYEIPGTDIDTLVALAGNEYYRFGSIDERSRVRSVALYGRPFGLNRLSAASETTLYTTDGSSYAVASYDVSGRLERSFRVERPNQPISEADQVAYREYVLGFPPFSGPERDRLEQTLESSSFPATMPAIRALAVDRLKNLWAEDYRPNPLIAATWNVFDGEGRWQASVILPAGLRVTDIGDSYILGVRKDSLDVEYVELYSLEKDHR